WQQCATFLTGDFNGDGKTDIAYAFNDNGYISIDAHLSTGGAFVNQRWATDNYNITVGQPGTPWGGVGPLTEWRKHSTFLAGDYNGDGKTDLALVYNNNGYINIDTHVSTGTSFYDQHWAINQGGWVGGDDWTNSGTFVAGDVNGDGKSDIVYLWN